MNSEIWLYIVISSLSVVLTFFLFKYVNLKIKLERKAKTIFELWKSEELNREISKVNELAIREAELSFAKWKQIHEKEIRKDAIDKSQAVIKGKMTEHLLPFFPSFQFNPNDARFLGSPIDLIVFDGLSEGDLKQIVFIEIKSGKKPTLTIREKQVKECILQKKVVYETIHLQSRD